MKSYRFLLLLTLGLYLGSCQKKTSETEHAGHSHEHGEAGHEGHDHEGHDHGDHDHHHDEEEGHEAEEAELTETQYKAAQITLGSLQQKAIAGTIQVTGVLSMPPQQQISISFPYGGIVRSTTLLPGKWVNKGEVLLTLENPEFITLQQEYLEAQSQLDYTEKENQRQSELSRENVSAAKTFQRSSAELQGLQARLQGLRQKLSLLQLTPAAVSKGIQNRIAVRASSSGYVTHVNVNTGKAVQANEMLAELADTRFVQAELTVFEKDLSKLRTGQKVQLQLGHETSPRTATVLLIGREITPERAVKVLCKLDQTNRDLVPGTYLTAQISGGSTEVATLPESAVVRSGDKQYIFVSEGTHKEEGGTHYPFKRLEIQTGLAQNGFVEVKLPEAVKPNTIVVKGAYDLLSVMNNSEHGHSH